MDIFDRPYVKRVKGSHSIGDESLTPSSHSSSGEEGDSPSQADHDTRPQYTFEYDFIDVTQPDRAISDGQHELQPHVSTSNDKQTFEFHLFASSPKATTTISPTTPLLPTTITIVPPQDPSSVPISELRFLKPNRPSSYYFTSALPSTELRQLRGQYSSVAVSSTEVIEMATIQQWPGTALSWRVIHIPAPALPSKIKSKESSTSHLCNPLPSNSPSTPTITITPSDTIPLTTSTPTQTPHSLRTDRQRRPKPSKKRRIQLRTRLAHRIQLTTQEKEAAQKDKRAAANRKNKLKRREREKRKKLEAETEGEAGMKTKMGTKVEGSGSEAGEDEKV